MSIKEPPTLAHDDMELWFSRQYQSVVEYMYPILREYLPNRGITKEGDSWENRRIECEAPELELPIGSYSVDAVLDCSVRIHDESSIIPFSVIVDFKPLMDRVSSAQSQLKKYNDAYVSIIDAKQSKYEHIWCCGRKYSGARANAYETVGTRWHSKRACYTLIRCNIMVIITMDMSERGWKFDDMLKAQGISVIHVPKEFVQSDLPLNKSSIDKVPSGPEGKRRFLEVTSRIFANPQKQAKKLTV
jgi:hypothetical protein